MNGRKTTILEAMASGLPITTTDTGGTNELINENGIIIPMRYSEAIADAILNPINNHILKKDLSLKSREITESMSWKNVAKEYYRIYEEILNGDYPLNYKMEKKFGKHRDTHVGLPRELRRLGERKVAEVFETIDTFRAGRWYGSKGNGDVVEKCIGSIETIKEWAQE